MHAPHFFLLCSFGLVSCLMQTTKATAQTASTQQSVKQAIIGDITSADGDAVAGAKVVVVNLASGQHFTETTDGLGSFRVAGLNPGGPYALQVMHPRFSHQVLTDIYLSASQPMRLFLTLRNAKATASQARQQP